MAKAERDTLQAWSHLPEEQLDAALDGATRRGELDDLLAVAAPDRGQVFAWPRAALAAAAIILVSLGALFWPSSNRLVDDLRILRAAQRANGSEPSELVARLRIAIDDTRVAGLVLANPFDPSAFDRAADEAGPLRNATTDGLRLLRPAGVLATPRPEFRIATGLPTDAAWAIEVTVRRVDSDEQHVWTAKRPADETDPLLTAPPVDLPPGLWRMEVRLAEAQGLDWRPAFGEFEITNARVKAGLLEPPLETGSPELDRLLRAARLLSANFATAALAELRDETELDAAGLLLEARALAILNDRPAVEAVRARWQHLTREGR